ncbi:hypothetical protein G8759_10555 [Spirosoma aureum]|uniref:Peptidase M19 n=1 Tax=Spirosoma aureum TaxID=2692134 RepID=A0A6G9AL75_9BACT|nr:hypothetical protein [Spirosoma aureum]QIP13035.1 hypothetical protein G8759_10555 [Spirosoma aureum]
MAFFFDSHIHPSLKKQFANPVEVPVSGLPTVNPWRTTDTKEFLKALNPLVKCLLRPFVESSLASQASLTQLTENNYKLAILVLFAPDKGILELIRSNKGFYDIVTNGGFGNILTKGRFDSLAGKDATDLDKIDPFSVIKNDLDLLFRENATHQKIEKLIDRNFEPTDADPLHAVFAVEGLHCLRNDLKETNPDTIVGQITTNLDSLLTSDHKIIAVNIAHTDFRNDIFANQAYAADGYRENGFHEDHLRPIGNGFTALGELIVKELYSREVLPDVKHMSWLARKQFYAFRDREFGNHGIDAPIVCSHAGFTGCWFDQPGEERFVDFIVTSKNKPNSDLAAISNEGNFQRKITLGKPCKQLDGIGFNASTINLFNEDIVAIFKSNGLIGLSLDQRILGYTEIIFDQIDDSPLTDNVSMNARGLQDVNLVTDTDFISQAELKAEPLFGQVSQNDNRVAGCVRLETFIQLHPIGGGNSTNVKDFIHPRHFYMHILHAMQLADRIGGEVAVEKMLGQTLCIGSDLDGLIDGLECCPDATHIGEFKNKFVQQFESYLENFNVSLPASLPIDKVADRLFFENGRDFVFARLDAINALP